MDRLEKVELFRTAWVRVIFIALYLLQKLVEVIALKLGSIWHIACQLSSREQLFSGFLAKLNDP
jgi:hypothetical protein